MEPATLFLDPQFFRLSPGCKRIFGNKANGSNKSPFYNHVSRGTCEPCARARGEEEKQEQGARLADQLRLAVAPAQPGRLQGRGRGGRNQRRGRGRGRGEALLADGPNDLGHVEVIDPFEGQSPREALRNLMDKFPPSLIAKQGRRFDDIPFTVKSIVSGMLKRELATYGRLREDQLIERARILINILAMPTVLLQNPANVRIGEVMRTLKVNLNRIGYDLSKLAVLDVPQEQPRARHEGAVPEEAANKVRHARTKHLIGKGQASRAMRAATAKPPADPSDRAVFEALKAKQSEG